MKDGRGPPQCCRPGGMQHSRQMEGRGALEIFPAALIIRHRVFKSETLQFPKPDSGAGVQDTFSGSAVERGQDGEATDWPSSATDGNADAAAPSWLKRGC